MEENNKYSPQRVTELPAQERPRERLFIHGSKVLSGIELFQLLLANGNKNQPIAELAYSLFAEFGSLQSISEATIPELCKIPGLGTAKASQIQACFEIARRMYGLSQVWEKLSVSSKFSTAEVVALIRSKISSFHKEHFLIASFDIRSRLVACDLISVGILNASLVHPRETFTTALKNHAAFVVIGHNHPSGDLEPSDEDCAVTARLSSAGKILGIELQDHVIVSEQGYFSFKERQLLN